MSSEVQRNAANLLRCNAHLYPEPGVDVLTLASVCFNTCAIALCVASGAHVTNRQLQQWRRVAGAKLQTDGGCFFAAALPLFLNYVLGHTFFPVQCWQRIEASVVSHLKAQQGLQLQLPPPPPPPSPLCRLVSASSTGSQDDSQRPSSGPSASSTRTRRGRLSASSSSSMASTVRPDYSKTSRWQLV